MPKSKVINLRIDPELKREAKKLAAEDGRSLSNWLTRMIEHAVKQSRKKDRKK